jgi:hypothetical protein
MIPGDGGSLPERVPSVSGPFALLRGMTVRPPVGGNWEAPPVAVMPDSDPGLFAGLTSGFHPPGGGGGT